MIYRNESSEKYYSDIIEDLSKFPFSFVYDGITYSGFSQDIFVVKQKSVFKKNDGETVSFVFHFKSGDNLAIKLSVTYYYDYGVIEWFVSFINISDSNTKIISSPCANIGFTGNFPVLKGIHGDHTGGYIPYSYDLTQTTAEFSQTTGRPTHIHFPYFNLEYGNKGVMLAIGWAGTWNSSFVYNQSTNTTKFKASSVININTYLKPGEEIRTALFVIARYAKRDENYATNFWRSWYINCNMPKANSKGDELKPFSTINLACDTGRPNSDGSISETYFTWKPSLEKLIEENIKIDYRWVDAGWYSAPDKSTVPEDWFGTTGSWELDENKWPGQSFLRSTEFAREHNMKTILWFEPERVTNPEDLYLNYKYDPAWAIGYKEKMKRLLNNIGNKDCYEWTKNKIIKVLTENKIEMYREDFNMDPAPYWAINDSKQGENRTGITECLCVAAHYRLWDEIIKVTKEQSGCAFVDTCASGGGRCDIESLRRSIPLLRSDSDRTSTSLRLSINTVYNKWIPFNGANTREKKNQLDLTGILDAYTFRASYLPVLNVEAQLTQDKTLDFNMMRKYINEWNNVNEYFLRDFYVLTNHHMPNDTTGFTSYAYHDKDTDSSLLFVFRMENCPYDEIKLSLPFADKKTLYVLKDFDNNQTFILNGTALSTHFKISIKEKRYAKLFLITKV